MELEVLLPLLGTVLSVVGLYIGIKKHDLNTRLDEVERELEDIHNNLLSSENKKYLSESQIVEINKDYNNFRKHIENFKKAKSQLSNKQSGKIDKAVLTFVIPSIAALSLVGLYIYLWVLHGDNPDYSTPEALNSVMSMVVGYLFGATTAGNN